MFSSSIVKGNIGVIHFGGGGVTSIPAYQIPFTLNSVLILSKHYFIKSTYYDHRRVQLSGHIDFEQALFYQKYLLSPSGIRGYRRIRRIPKDTKGYQCILMDTKRYQCLPVVVKAANLVKLPTVLTTLLK